MNYQKKTFYAFAMSCIVCFSCNRETWKQRYVLSKMISFQKKYSGPDGLRFGFNQQDSLVNFTSVKKSSRKEIKKNIQFLEKALALVPDSTSENKTEIDSFYLNTNKIYFIEKNRLASKNMLFIEKQN